MLNSHKRALRGDVGGWSHQSTRSNTRFLYSVDETRLTGHGLGITLTLRDCPPTHTDWHRLRNAFTRRLRRLGMIRLHWVTEWQRRGVPHLHGAVWMPPSVDPVPDLIRQHWLDLTAEYGAGRGAQFITSITDSVGWFQYLSKHAARGVSHYQRSAENIPQGWKKTGRMWGRWGEWPIDEPDRFELPNGSPGYFAYRRILRNWRIADARSEKNIARILSARRMLKCNLRELSSVRGTSEWIGREENYRMMKHLKQRGFEVTN